MENNQNQSQDSSEEKDRNQNVINNYPSDRRPDEQEQNDTAFAGTTNSISENRQESDEYKPAIEDTLIGYDGDESDLEIRLDDGNVDTENTRGVDDND